MTLLARCRRALVMGIVAVAATVSMTQVASAEPAPPKGPDAVAVPPGNKVFLLAKTKVGDAVQIYQCNADPTKPNTFTWSFVEPRATLIADNGQVVNHFVGPTWQAKDGSKVQATVANGGQARVTVDRTAIPWLLLSATSTSAGPDGDRLTNTTFIQRINTTGGLAPDPAECNQAAATAKTRKEVQYTADYLFWKKTGKPGT